MPRIVSQLRQASLEDFGQIAALQAEHGLGGWSPEEWRHLWAENPAYQERQTDWPIGWVLEANQKIVGYLGNIPVQYELEARRLLAGSGHCWVVAPAYRGHSLRLLNSYVQQKQANLLVANTVTLESCRPLRLFGGSRVPVGVWDKSYVWITNYTGFAASWLSRKNFPLPGVLSYPISTGMFCRDVLVNRRIPKNGNGSSTPVIECSEKFDDRFDHFWEALRSENPRKLLAVRSRQVLEWHFRFAIAEKRIWVVTALLKGRLHAYAVFLLQRTANDGLKRLTLIDFQSLPFELPLFFPMMTWALERCRREGVHVVKYIGACPPGIADIGALAPYHVKQDSWTFWYKTLDSSLAGKLRNPDVWAPSLFDGDASVGII